jgi:membrane-bound inhibitor of C-type lysozyme
LGYVIIGVLGMVVGFSAPSGVEAQQHFGVAFRCEQGVQIEVEYLKDDTVTVVMSDAKGVINFGNDDGPIKLQRLRSASGARYGNGTMIFWEKGGEAMLLMDDRKIAENCEAVK